MYCIYVFCCEQKQKADQTRTDRENLNPPKKNLIISRGEKERERKIHTKALPKEARLLEI
jgi:hypothetical protein